MLGSSYVISLSCMLEYKMISVAPSLSIFLLVNTNVPSIVSAKYVVPICVVPSMWCQICGAKYLSIVEYKCSFYCGAKYVVPNVWCQMCGAVVLGFP